MNLREMRSIMKEELHTVRSRRVFEQAKFRSPVLGNHTSFDDLLALLSNEEPSLYPQKDAVVRALIVEHQRCSTSLWSQVLTVAFYPMLQGQVRRARVCFAEDEAVQLVLVRFLEILHGFVLSPDTTHLCARLRSGVRRRVSVDLRKEKRTVQRIRSAESQILGEQGAYEAETSKAFTAPERKKAAKKRSRPTSEECPQVVRVLRQFAGRSLSEDELTLLIATDIYGESLTHFVRRTQRSASQDECRRIYERFKKFRHRTLAKARKILSEAQRQGYLEPTPAIDGGLSFPAVLRLLVQRLGLYKKAETTAAEPATFVYVSAPKKNSCLAAWTQGSGGLSPGCAATAAHNLSLVVDKEESCARMEAVRLVTQWLRPSTQNIFEAEVPLIQSEDRLLFTQMVFQHSNSLINPKFLFYLVPLIHFVGHPASNPGRSVRAHGSTGPP